VLSLSYFSQGQHRSIVAKGQIYQRLLSCFFGQQVPALKASGAGHLNIEIGQRRLVEAIGWILLNATLVKGNRLL
jgi:hypothetical protein